MDWLSRMMESCRSEVIEAREQMQQLQWLGRKVERRDVKVEAEDESTSSMSRGGSSGVAVFLWSLC